MQVVLTKRVAKLGNVNDVVNVKAGFARNFLFPQSMAVPATKAAVAHAEKIKETMVQKMEDMLKDAKGVAEQLKAVTLNFKKKARGEKLYGSIKDADIVDGLKDQAKLEIMKDMVKLDEPLKDLGEHTVKLQLAEDVSAEVKVVVEAE